MGWGGARPCANNWPVTACTFTNVLLHPFLFPSSGRLPGNHIGALRRQFSEPHCLTPRAVGAASFLQRYYRPACSLGGSVA